MQSRKCPGEIYFLDPSHAHACKVQQQHQQHNSLAQKKYEKQPMESEDAKSL